MHLNVMMHLRMLRTMPNGIGSRTGPRLDVTKECLLGCDWGKRLISGIP